MAKRKDIEITGGEAAASSSGAPEPAQTKSELPSVESPPISPATETPAIATDAPATAIEPIAAAAPAVEPIMDAAPVAKPRFVLRPRHKRYALLAASVTFAAALGAVVGALASGGFSTPARPDVAAVEENKAMQQSIARLGKEITTLKTSLEQANKSAHTQIAKISERLEHATEEVTGSISAPQMTAPVLTPLPSPRPAQRFAAVDPPPPARPSVVAGWTIRDIRNGYVYVENHGELYQVVLGAPLPGLGPVQSVKRQDGRWVVLTPKGIIVSMRDRRYFDDF
ncbi:MAG TPA: hypothetical protein VFC32_02960 [Pseudolabrys sp.]|nr:hypothetical protein [Pseudolabrys sp.]